jgi:hypothetical protein
MKKIGGNLIPIYYAKHVWPTMADRGQNQLKYEEMISTGASTLLRGGFFLQGGKDENVIPSLF